MPTKRVVSREDLADLAAKGVFVVDRLVREGEYFLPINPVPADPDQILFNKADAGIYAWEVKPSTVYNPPNYEAEDGPVVGRWSLQIERQQKQLLNGPFALNDINQAANPAGAIRLQFRPTPDDINDATEANPDILDRDADVACWFDPQPSPTTFIMSGTRGSYKVGFKIILKDIVGGAVDDYLQLFVANRQGGGAEWTEQPFSTLELGRGKRTGDVLIFETIGGIDLADFNASFDPTFEGPFAPFRISFAYVSTQPVSFSINSINAYRVG